MNREGKSETGVNEKSKDGDQDKKDI